MSQLHEIIVELLRRSPELLCQWLGDRIPPLSRGRLCIETDLTRASQLLAVDTDLVLRVRDRRGKLLCALVVEVQLRRRKAKARTWALYAAWAHYRLRCPVHVIVVAVDASVAKWAAGPFCIGDMTLRPWVIGPEHIQPITSRAKARRAVELTFLSGLAHCKQPVAVEVGRALWHALDQTEHEHASLLWDIYTESVDPAVRRALEMSLDDYVPHSDWGKGFYRKGMAEGRREGKAEGRREGRREGEAKGVRKGRREGEAEALLVLLRARRIRVTPAQRKRVRACGKLEQLRAWLRRAATATTAAEVFDDG